MKKVLNILVLISVVTTAVPAFAAPAHGECQKAALSAALEEVRKEFPDSPGRISVDSIHEAQNVVTIEVENENISDLPLDVTVQIKRSGSSCEVVGQPQVIAPDPS